MVILDKEYTVRYNLRAMFVMEEITGKSFEIKTLFDEYVLLYSCIVSVKENPALDFDEMIDYCDEHPEVLSQFNEYISSEINRRNRGESNDAEGKDKKKVKNI